MLQVPLNVPRHKPSFLQRSTSVASLMAWRERFETYSGKFLKEPSFISYTTKEDCIPYKLAGEGDTIYNNGPDNDLPPEYAEAVTENPPPPFPHHEEKNHQNISFQQDFTALESYLKKKLCVKNKANNTTGTGNAELETSKVFQWLHELPQGDNLEEFLEAYGIPTKGIDVDDLKRKLKVFVEEKLTAVNGVNQTKTQSHAESETLSRLPRWKRQMIDLEDLAYEDNLEKWLESLDVPYFRPIPETKNEIRKYLKLPTVLEKASSMLSISHIDQSSIPTVQPNDKYIEPFAPKWKELVEKMRSIKNEEELEKWLESLDVPHHVDRAKIAIEIRKFFRHETFENFKGKSLVLQENTFAKELWDKFEDSSTLKKVGVIAGTTAVLGIVAVLSTTMLSFAVPAAFAINPFFIEVFAQYFLQRQEVAFNLLNFHTQNAKPLSQAWAKQYVLWKYC